MNSLQKFMLVNSYLLLFLAGTLKGKTLPDDAKSAAPSPTGEAATGEAAQSDTANAAAPTATGEGQTAEGAAQENAAQEGESAQEDGGAGLQERTLPANKQSQDKNRQEEEAMESRGLDWKINDIENPSSANIITEYMKRITAIRKFVRIYEEIIRKIDKSLEGVARKLAAGLGDLTNFMRNIRGPQDVPRDGQRIY